MASPEHKSRDAAPNSLQNRDCGSKRTTKNGQSQQLKLDEEPRGQTKVEELMCRLQKLLNDEPEIRSAIASGLSSSPTDKPNAAPKPQVKEPIKPMEIKLHTEMRAIKRAGFNHFVASKIQYMEQQRKQEETIQKMMEKEQIKLLRKEMIPRAKLMPFFDKPFFPQRSTKRLTVPKEPSFHILSSRCAKRTTCNVLCYPVYENVKPVK
ncbi:microtubule-destabilizing protein 60 [Nymphaea colorata]|nr:microtubule-destabilizing protein 60 [Nymphaea colorata]